MNRPVAKVDENIWRKIGDDIVVIKDDEVSVHVLNKTAAFIWELCDATRGVDEITTSVCERFEVSPEQARVDVEETLEGLEKIGIIDYNGEPAGG